MSHRHPARRTGLAAFAASLPASLLVLMASASTATAQDAPAEPGSRWSVDLGASFTSAYYFRGILQEDDGLIFQPSIDLGLLLHEEEDLEVSFFTGAWSSFHGENTGASSDAGIRSWYELDLYAGLALAKGDWSGSVQFVAYTSPNNAFEQVEEILVNVGYDDSEDPLLGIALQPSAALAFEFGSTGAFGDDTGIYGELGIAPGWDFEDAVGAHDLSVSVPVTAGLSLSNYFETMGSDDFLGYVDLGLDAALDLDTDASFGAISVSAGVHLLWLGSNLEDLNGGDAVEVVFSGGVSISF